MKQKRFSVLGCAGLVFFLLLPLSAQDFTMKTTGEVVFPLAAADSEEQLFSTGGGGRLSAGLDLFGFLSPAIEASVLVVPGFNTENQLSLASGGIGLNVFIYPVSRLKINAGGSAGMYMATFGDAQLVNWYWRAGLTGGFRLSPELTVNLGADYRSYLQADDVLVSAISAEVSLDINFSSVGTGTGMGADILETHPVFPLLYGSYAKQPFGTILIRNNEQAEVQNLVVSFSAGDYTEAPVVCATIPFLARGESREIPLYAKFAEQVLTLSEDTELQGELQFAYSFLDSPRTQTVPAVIGLNHRNAISWADRKILSVFISPTDPAVLEFTKLVAGLVRNKVRNEIDKNLQYGMGLFEGLRVTGIAYSSDPNSPYASFVTDPGKTDYVQFPYQTLAYKGGDSDDLGILYAAALLSVDVPCALISFDDEILVAIKVGMTEANARATFIEPETLIYRDGEAWIPIKISAVREGFLRAWQLGAMKWQESAKNQTQPVFFTPDQGWEQFPAVGIPGVEVRVPKPTEDQLNLAFENSMNRFISREIGPRVQRMLSEMQPGRTTVRQYNSLGLLYARYGMLIEAKGQFEKAAAENYVPALVNLGNVSVLQKNYQEAVVFFERALKLQPDNKAALVGLAQAKYELNDFAAADEIVGMVRALDPALADRYGYIASRNNQDGARASSAAERTLSTWAEE